MRRFLKSPPELRALGGSRCLLGGRKRNRYWKDLQKMMESQLLVPDCAPQRWSSSVAWGGTGWTQQEGPSRAPGITCSGFFPNTSQDSLEPWRGDILPLPRRRWITWGRTGMPVCQQMAPLGGLMDVGSTDQAVTNQRRLG